MLALTLVVNTAVDAHWTKRTGRANTLVDWVGVRGSHIRIIHSE